MVSTSNAISNGQHIKKTITVVNGRAKGDRGGRKIITIYYIYPRNFFIFLFLGDDRNI